MKTSHRNELEISLIFVEGFRNGIVDHIIPRGCSKLLTFLFQLKRINRKKGRLSSRMNTFSLLVIPMIKVEDFTGWIIKLGDCPANPFFNQIRFATFLLRKTKTTTNRIIMTITTIPTMKVKLRAGVTPLDVEIF